MEFFNVSPSEKRIIEELRSLKPFEQVIITADKQGKPDRFLINYQRKIILTLGISEPVQ
jgi:hypothetical protein